MTRVGHAERDPLGAKLDAHRDQIWGLAYRMLGDPAAAEDVVQDTFARALEKQSDYDFDGDPVGGWLCTVATRMCIDRLRRRKAAGYDGPWLPIPVHELPAFEARAASDADPELQLGAKESASLAMLWALEALEPRARAALLLNGVLGYTGPELADMLGVTPGNVRVILHRARKTLAEGPGLEHGQALRAEQWPELMGRVMQAIAANDVDGLERLFADDVKIVNDADGKFKAARKVLVGPGRAARFFLGIAKKSGTPESITPVEMNGELGLWTRRSPRNPGDAADTLMLVRVRAGRICRSFSWLEPDKLDRVAGLVTS